MDNKIKKELLIAYIRVKFSNVQISEKNLGLGTLSMLFDQIEPCEIKAFLPDYFIEHLEQLNKTKNGFHLTIWALKLATYVNLLWTDILTDSLRKEFVDALGADKVYAMRRFSSEASMKENEVENQICRGFISCLLQYILEQKISNDMVVQIKNDIEHVDYCELLQIQKMMKILLIQHLKLDMGNPEHLGYWQKETNKGVLNLGGETICLSQVTYRVPHRIKKMMKAIKNHSGSYNDLLLVLDDIRMTQGWLPSFNKKFRNNATDKIYLTENLENVDLEEEQSDIDHVILEEIEHIKDDSKPQVSGVALE